MASAGRPRVPIVLSDEERAELERITRAHSSSQKLVLRARIVLLAAEDLPTVEIAARLGTSQPPVSKWRKRFAEHRLAGLADADRSGAPPRIDPARIRTVVEETRFARPPDGASHWSSRQMAEHAGLSQSAVVRIWQAFRLQPHRVNAFKLSTDPLFIDKVIDVVGLYTDPPDHAVVLCADEKSQIQALERTRPGHNVAPGHPATRTHDDVRHGTTTLFAAFDIVTGQVIHDTHERHRSTEWLDFLRRIDTEVPPELDVHLVCDNYDTHKTKSVRDWLAEHERFHVHFTPTSASWLNQVERWFGLIQNRLLARGEFTSTDDLAARIAQWTEHYNTDPRPFIWTKPAKDIIEKFLRIQNRLI
ncbi:IS630 family transposase [Nocardiopsis sp. CNR-923]|uniref:IS630 family transposase n=1 Tax=Nocardiopsis sp. CNR-923 TaxID=1904965 RepID=UPI000959FE51|nr:IS630 family transposase [Nocardiopsis sp. CNR-923]OLT30175.1 IS630 family transposase [Nocardiopsis sp. CNR-923]